MRLDGLGELGRRELPTFWLLESLQTEVAGGAQSDRAAAQGEDGHPSVPGVNVMLSCCHATEVFRFTQVSLVSLPFRHISVSVSVCIILIL